jgi:glucose-1-phosphate thymidylyltransferase
VKGILLAGGSGTRLHPLTLATSKQLLPVYDKPMVYYPLSTLMLAGVRDILVITTPEDQGAFKRLLGSGEQWGIKLSYVIQPKPEGLAQAYVLGEDFVGAEPSALILGDNIYFGQGLTASLGRAAKRVSGATVFAYHVNHPQQYGVVTFDDFGRAIAIEEKPAKPKSFYAVTGLYFYDGRATSFASRIKPSKRGEFEITALNNMYLKAGDLAVEILGRGFAWFDTGTHESLLQASEFVHTIETRQGMKVGSPEEVAFHMGYIDKAALLELAGKMSKSGYGSYLQAVANNFTLPQIAL